MVPEYELFINNESHAPEGGYFEAINPYDGAIHARIPQASTAQVDQAIAAARCTYDTVWKHSDGNQRSRLLLRLADLLDANAEQMGRLESTDNGKVIRETVPQMRAAARAYRFFAGAADKIFGMTIPVDLRDTFDFTRREALGVCVLITAWNSPISLLTNKLAPALAAGNCVVVKPSEHASRTTLEFARLVQEAGFPAGVFNVVTGDSRVGSALLAGDRIDKVSFTGSPQVARLIAAQAAQALVPVTLELGGKSPNIIFADAAIDRAVVGALAGIFGATGQTCVAGSRLLVERSVRDEVVARLAERATAIRMGDPLDPQTEMGTVANEPQFNRIMERIAGAHAEGARLVTGGARGTGPGLDQGFFIQPTIFDDVSNGMELAQEEIFGPVLAVIPFDSEEEAVAIANDTRFGLAAGVWTRDLNRSLRMVQAIHAGTVWVNTYRASQAAAPFGGFGESGYGKERGVEALDSYLQTKNVMIDFSSDARDPFALKL